jgi:hypothetical protein
MVGVHLGGTIRKPSWAAAVTVLAAMAAGCAQSASLNADDWSPPPSPTAEPTASATPPPVAEPPDPVLPTDLGRDQAADDAVRQSLLKMALTNTGVFSAHVYAPGIEVTDRGSYALDPMRQQVSRTIRVAGQEPIGLRQLSVGNDAWVQMSQVNGQLDPTGTCWIFQDPALISEHFDVSIPDGGYGVPAAVILFSYAVGREFVGQSTRKILGTTNLFTAFGTLGAQATGLVSLPADSTDRVAVTIELHKNSVTMDIAWRDLVAALMASDAKLPKDLRATRDEEAVLTYKIDFVDLRLDEIAEPPAERDVVRLDELSDDLPRRCAAPVVQEIHPA